MVFHTAPPQPASKARMICSPQLVGGAEASQNGLSALMAPAKPRTRMSGMNCLHGLQHSKRSPFAVGNRIDHFPATVDAVAPGEITRVAGAARGGIGNDAAVADLDLTELLHQMSERRLADGGHNQVAGD